jgi:hypothetical protein
MNRIKFIGFITIVMILGLSLMSCGEKKGGTFEFKNTSNDIVFVYAAKGEKDKVPEPGSYTFKKLEPGDTETVELTEDGIIHCLYHFEGLGLRTELTNISVSKGNTVKKEPRQN